MKKIIFSVALLNISLIFSTPKQSKEPKALTKEEYEKASIEAIALTKEEYEKASMEAIKCDYELIDTMIESHPDKIPTIKSEDQAAYDFVTEKVSECRIDGKNYTYDCLSKIDQIVHKYFLTKHIDSHHAWQDCICGKNNSRGYSFCERNKPVVKKESRLTYKVKK